MIILCFNIPSTVIICLISILLSSVMTRYVWIMMSWQEHTFWIGSLYFYEGNPQASVGFPSQRASNMDLGVMHFHVGCDLSYEDAMPWFIVVTWAPFYWHGLTLILAWISNYTHYNGWDEITNPFLNLNGAFIPHFTVHVIIYPCWD